MTRPTMLLLLAFAVTGCDSIKKVRNFTKEAAEAADRKVRESSGRGGLVHQLTADDFHRFIDQDGRLVVVDFYADWCGPCKQLSPLLDDLAMQYGDRVMVGKVNVEHEEEIARKAGVQGIPDLRFYRDGRQVDKIVGLPPERTLRARFDKHMPDEAEAPQEREEPEAENPGTGQSGKDIVVPEKPKEPAIQPMKKDWLPPGMQRKGG